MYNTDGTAYQPEPMQKCLEVKNKTSPCTNFLAGLWYLAEPHAAASEITSDSQIAFQTSSGNNGPAEVTFLYPNNFFEGIWWFFRDGAIAMWDGVTGLLGGQEANLLASVPFDENAVIDVQEGGYVNGESDTVPVLAANAPSATQTPDGGASSEPTPAVDAPSVQGPVSEPQTATDQPDSTDAPVPPQEPASQEAGGSQPEPAETPPPPPPRSDPLQPHNDNGWNAGGFYGPADRSTVPRGSSSSSASAVPTLFALSDEESGTWPLPDTVTVAYEPGSDTFLAAWARRYQSDLGIYDIVGKRFDGNGKPLDAQPFTIASPQMRQPVGLQLVAGHGMFFLVWYGGYSGATDTPVWYKSAAARILPDGTVLDPDGFHVVDQNGTACTNSPVAAAIPDGFLLLCFQASFSGGVSGGSAEIAGTRIATDGAVSLVRSFTFIQPSAGGPFDLVCSESDRCVFGANWRGHTLLYVFTAADFLSGEWRASIFRGCTIGSDNCGLPVVWQTPYGISLAPRADGGFAITWEAIDTSDGTRKGVALRELGVNGAFTGEPAYLDDSLEWHNPQLPDDGHIFYHTTVLPYRLGIAIASGIVSATTPPESLQQNSSEPIWPGVSASCGAHACVAFWTTLGSTAWHLNGWSGPR